MLKFRCQAARHSDTLLRRFRKIKSGEAKSKREVNSLDLRSCLILFWLWASGNNMATGRQTASTHGRLCPRHLNSEFYVLCRTFRQAVSHLGSFHLLTSFSPYPFCRRRRREMRESRSSARVPTKRKPAWRSAISAWQQRKPACSSSSSSTSPMCVYFTHTYIYVRPTSLPPPFSSPARALV